MVRAGARCAEARRAPSLGKPSTVSAQLRVRDSWAGCDLPLVYPRRLMGLKYLFLQVFPPVCPSDNLSDSLENTKEIKPLHALT